MIALKNNELRLASAVALAGFVALGALWGGCAADEANTGNSSSGTATGTGTGTGTGNDCPGATLCGDVCVDTDWDPNNCGGCGVPCDTAAGELCSNGQCGTQCGGGTIQCGDSCVNIANNEQHCGGCDSPCDPGEFCVSSSCQSSCTLTDCGGECVDTNWDPTHCGGCTTVCDPGQVCVNGLCSNDCGPGLSKCDDQCVNLNTSEQYCGNCNTTCGSGQDCVNGNCITCDSNTTDCDGDGWLGSEGDCCDKTGACGLEPELVNPGAIEVVGNGVDDNCNNLTDLFDTADTLPCDGGLASSSSNPLDYVKAMGLCRFTEENPADPADRTWGVISAELVRADGSVLDYAGAKSIRSGFGGSITPINGQAAAVLSSGIAADATQTNPGPNGGAPGGFNVSTSQPSTVDISNCADPKCIDDWFNASNPPLKNPGELNAAPNCGDPTLGPPNEANDSVMLYLRLRAPTNAKAFSFNSYFFSAEYPEYVCTDFNDQFIALVDTPGGTPQPIPNPTDKNLLVHSDGADKWPIGINVAAGTDLFAVCNQGDIPNQCQTSQIDPLSCQFGVGDLAGTGFEDSGGCIIGGGTFWLTTAGNIIPGDIVELRIVIWDVGDTAFDSLAILDGFSWLASATLPGTDG